MQELNTKNTINMKELTTRKSELQILLKTDEDDARPVYISGNFNNWRTQDKDFGQKERRVATF